MTYLYMLSSFEPQGVILSTVQLCSLIFNTHTYTHIHTHTHTHTYTYTHTQTVIHNQQHIPTIFVTHLLCQL